MNFMSYIVPGRTAAVSYTHDLDVLVAVLPTFIDLAERALAQLESSCTGPIKEVSETKRFYENFYCLVVNLHARLVGWNLFEIVQGRPDHEHEVRSALRGILDGLEICFLSQNKFELEFEQLGLKVQRCLETHPKLKALQRKLQKDGELDEQAIDGIQHIIRISKTSKQKRENLLSKLARAVNLIDRLELLLEESESACPQEFREYPSQHVRDLTEIMFETIQKNWYCKCPHSTLPVGRRARLNLTQYQRFEMAPTGNEIRRKDEVKFQILFPGNSMDLKWQKTDITISKNRCCDNIEASQMKKGLCGVIHKLLPGQYPQMIISDRRLWQLRTQVGRDRSFRSQIVDTEFQSLQVLLQPNGTINRSYLSSVRSSDRLILSCILATFVLHSFGEPWLQGGFSSANISFLFLHQQALPDITKPYFTSSCSHTRQAFSADIDQTHRFPDILSLGIILLEIASGSPIEILECPDRCLVALKAMDAWEENWRSDPFATIPEGLRQAIAACLEPNESTKGKLGEKHVNLYDVRKYIFEKILYPLGDALGTAYGIQLDSLFETTIRPRGIRVTGSFDHKDETQQQNMQDAKEWRENLEKVHDLFYKCERRYETCKANREKARVKVAVLDTGLQLGETLHKNFEDAGQIDSDTSTDFVINTEGAATDTWKEDHDGHGSRIGQIILDIAPGVVLHLAKVFQDHDDLKNPDMASEVYGRIVKAIECATQEWQVDIIVMSFGFDKPILSIKGAIDRAARSAKPPLFFAATRNEAAHKPMAWPANEMSVIGISSTAGTGRLSDFNPSRGSQDSILYAFGEGVEVKIADRSESGAIITKHVSGTSYATAVAAGLAANLLGCVRMIVDTSSPEDKTNYEQVPESLQRMDGMLPVLKCRMQSKNVRGEKSLLPWNFLSVNMLHENRILSEVDDTLQKRCRCDICT
ncbi:hypothetical protein BJ166DRAFT_542643 [Pestalotiopsis sp. NC0098]|nr:hypothetical protein BJ166DRAFT_542643 [Pestalotiopsis sp. NC0098]